MGVKSAFACLAAEAQMRNVPRPVSDAEVQRHCRNVLTGALLPTSFNFRRVRIDSPPVEIRNPVAPAMKPAA